LPLHDGPFDDVDLVQGVAFVMEGHDVLVIDNVHRVPAAVMELIHKAQSRTTGQTLPFGGRPTVLLGDPQMAPVFHRDLPLTSREWIKYCVTLPLATQFGLAPEYAGFVQRLSQGTLATPDATRLREQVTAIVPSGAIVIAMPQQRDDYNAQQLGRITDDLVDNMPQVQRVGTPPDGTLCPEQDDVALQLAVGARVQLMEPVGGLAKYALCTVTAITDDILTVEDQDGTAYHVSKTTALLGRRSDKSVMVCFETPPDT
jgi:hypothetical protein